MAIYEEKAPATFTIPNTVNGLVQSNFQSTIDFIWNELLAFNFNNGQSRVFANPVLSTDTVENSNRIVVYPNPVGNNLNIKSAMNLDLEEIKIFDLSGRLVMSKLSRGTMRFDISDLSLGMYLLKGINSSGQQFFKTKFNKH